MPRINPCVLFTKGKLDLSLISAEQRKFCFHMNGDVCKTDVKDLEAMLLLKGAARRLEQRTINTIVREIDESALAQRTWNVHTSRRLRNRSGVRRL